MIPDDRVSAMLRAAIKTALRAAAQTRQRFIVGLREEPSGAELIHILEAEYRANPDLSFTPGWIVSPEGEVIPWLARGQDVRPA